ncbi:MAG: class A beta-lactamase-related serine hydrolase [Ignavibacteriaceae bacterium]|jgi:beta-lactamase class A
MKISIVFLFSLSVLIYPQHKDIKVPDYYKIDNSLSDSLLSIVKSVGLDSNYDAGEDGIEQISFAVIDLNSNPAELGGVNFDNLIYPASVYKMYVAASILKQISEGKFSLYNKFVVKSPNDVDKSKQMGNDPRPLLKDNDTVTINYLLDLMITRSDNSAANCLIDKATRPEINKMIDDFGWYGSEVTRKFLKRKYEDPGYETIRGTETCALHAADFMYRIYNNELVNPWVSMQMKSLLGRQLDTSKLSKGLPPNVMFYHKTGWWSIYTNDVGIVDGGNVKYVIALFTPVTEDIVTSKMKILSEKVYELMKKRMM